MYTVQREYLCEVVQEVDPLLRLHYDELTLHKDRVALDPDWERYAKLESLNVLQVLSCRKNGFLVGYSAFFVQPHLHYAALRCAINDVLFVHPEHRGRAGIMLIRHAEREFKGQKVDKIVYHAKQDTTLIPVLTKMGYQVEEIMLGKMLAQGGI